MKTLQLKFKIISNLPVGGKYFKLTLDAGKIAQRAIPGQFIMLKVSDGLSPLLRRPLGVHRVNKNKVELLYEVIGPGTKILMQKKPGEYLDIIGPLGNGFTLKQRPVLIAGGMGVAPLVFLAGKLSRQKPLVLIGAKTKNHILCVKEFKKFSCAVKIATDDGSLGFKGRVTDLFRDYLSTINHRTLTIYACGPKPMLREVAAISQKYSVPAQISLEAHMSCGFGACMGCAVETKAGQKRVCQDGPVFDSQEVIW